jgi:hypothetical protein
MRESALRKTRPVSDSLFLLYNDVNLAEKQQLPQSSAHEKTC